MPPMSLTGMVTSVGKMSKTATVTVARLTQHPRTRKVITRSKKYLTHDPQDQLAMGDKVVIRNCPPVSKQKRFVFESKIQQGASPTSSPTSTTTAAQTSS
ncbi:hypothetical protein FRC04_009407 [Tulasnella sp. 424]|nr:hypothetical protein FRC04_009407 [Tulasnella sp. 424]KAG8971857.1 hypothetical protein FRC05_010524 [Tulasnella sp. 425]